MFFGSSPCLLGQHGSCTLAQLPVELSENMLQSLFLNLLPQTVLDMTLDPPWINATFNGKYGTRN